MSAIDAIKPLQAARAGAGEAAAVLRAIDDPTADVWAEHSGVTARIVELVGTPNQWAFGLAERGMAADIVAATSALRGTHLLPRDGGLTRLGDVLGGTVREIRHLYPASAAERAETVAAAIREFDHVSGVLDDHIRWAMRAAERRG